MSAVRASDRLQRPLARQPQRGDAGGGEGHQAGGGAGVGGAAGGGDQGVGVVVLDAAVLGVHQLGPAAGRAPPAAMMRSIIATASTRIVRRRRSRPTASGRRRPRRPRWRRRRPRRGWASGESIIDSSIWVATITGMPRWRAARTMVFCTTGTSSGSSSTPRSPRATITAVAQVEDRVQVLQRRRLFDLGQHRGAALHQLAQLGHVGGPLHEGQRHPVDADAQREGQVVAVLGGQRRQRDDRAGQGDALVVGQLLALASPPCRRSPGRRR